MTPLAQKLQIKPGKKWLIYNAPKGYLKLLEPLPERATCTTAAKGVFDGIQLFAKNKAELSSALNVIGPLLKPDTVFWVAYPKRSSGMESDMKMGSWDEMTAYRLQGVSSIAVNAKWAGSRFRPEGRSKISGTGNSEIRKNDYAAYIDVDKKVIRLPLYLKRILQQTPKALTFYQQLSYSNRKEYLLWILTAKQEKTRNERLVKLIQKLVAGKKNPSEK
jgi:Bacteriocin-protection, YdeI or OmpD-Associated